MSRPSVRGSVSMVGSPLHGGTAAGAAGARGSIYEDSSQQRYSSAYYSTDRSTSIYESEGLLRRPSTEYSSRNSASFSGTGGESSSAYTMSMTQNPLTMEMSSSIPRSSSTSAGRYSASGARLSSGARAGAHRHTGMDSLYPHDTTAPQSPTSSSSSGDGGVFKSRGLSCCCCVAISTSEVGLVEHCGRYDHMADAGCLFFCWPFQRMDMLVSLRVQEKNFQCDTKTKDNVFVTVSLSVQYQVRTDGVYAAHYLLQNHESTLVALVSDAMRSVSCAFTLDRMFEAKEEISLAIKGIVGPVMEEYGFRIHQTLVTDIDPPAHVKHAMNEINSSQRYCSSAVAKGDGDKVVTVKRAEASAEGMYLQGVGVARSRGAMLNGVRESVMDFLAKDGTSGQGGPLDPVEEHQKLLDARRATKEAVELLLCTQYCDTLSEMGQAEGCSVVYVDSSGMGTGRR